MKWVIRSEGSQALSGIMKYEIKAKIVTPAMIMGASKEILLARSQMRVEKKRTVQVLASDRPRVGRKQDSDDPAIPEHTNELERLAPPTETPLRLGESGRGAEQTTKANQTVGCSAGDTGGRDEGGECHIGGKDGASDQRGDTPDNDDGVTGLTVVDLGNPTREGKDTVAGDCEDETRSGDNGNGGVLAVSA